MPDFRVELQSRAAAVRRRDLDPRTSAARGARPHPLVQLQNHVGNAQVARLLAQRESLPEEEPEEIQPRHDPTVTSHESGPSVGLEGGPVRDDVAGRIDSARGTGSGLSETTRTQMEPAFGADFSGVRLHHDSESDALARSMTAKAFTTGADIFLRQDASPSDTSLLAHELTHVVQQDFHGAGSAASGMNVSPAGDPLERHAESVAEAVVSDVGAQRQFEEGRPTEG